MQREGHQLALVATKDSFRQDPAFHWLADLRRGRRNIWGSILRFIDVSVRRRVPKEVLDHLPQLLQSYIDDQFDAPTPPQPTTHRKIA